MQTSITTESLKSTIPCNLCGGSDGDVEILATRDRNNKPMQTVICLDCGLVWIDPRPSADATKKFYTEEYRKQYKSTFKPKMKHVYRDMKRAIERFKRIRPMLVSGMKILDIGAGAGFFPYVVKQNSYEVAGLEPNIGYAQYANEEFQLDIKVGFIQDIEFENSSFDIVTLNHVLEHLEGPFTTLTRLFDWLKPGGHLNVEVPNIEASYHAPRNKFHLAHLYTFNPENLKLLGEKAGYSVNNLQIVPGTKHINIIFQKPKDPGSNIKFQGPYAISGNYERIRKIHAAHSTLSHYLSTAPYLRFLRKNAGYLYEKIAVSRFTSGRDVADYLIGQQKG